MCSSWAPDGAGDLSPRVFALNSAYVLAIDLVVNRREDRKNKRDSKPSITTTPQHDHHHLHDHDAEFALMIRALNEGRSPYERRTIARTFVGGLAAATLL